MSLILIQIRKQSEFYSLSDSIIVIIVSLSLKIYIVSIFYDENIIRNSAH